MKKYVLILSILFMLGGTVYAEETPHTVLHINSDTVDEFFEKAETSENSAQIGGCIVTYDSVTECDLYIAFYKNESLCGISKTELSINIGNNYFNADIESPQRYKECDVRYYLWDKDMAVITNDTEFYRLKDFSDKYEPYYPMITASQKTAEEIYNATVSTEFELTEKQRSARMSVVEMYKNAGIDVTRGVNNLAYNIFSIPTSWSELTPKSLTGEYEQAFSVDACFNRKIPKTAPEVKLNEDVIDLSDFHLAVINTDEQTGGQGTGIARIIADREDPVMSIAAIWSSDVIYIQNYYKRRIPQNVDRLLNNNPSADRHAIFIDDETKTGVHTFKTVPPNGRFPYDINSGRLPNYDIRGLAAGNVFDLTGIGAEGKSGVYAAYVLADGMTIKANEINNPDTMIEHALSGAVNPVMYGVVYPAMASDAGGINDNSNFGAVPEGGLIRLDKKIDLTSLYNSGKISLPAYKILKAMQEYGMYNVDRTSNGKGKGVMLYTSTSAQDWLNASDESFNVPFMNGVQGYNSVMSEIKAFFEGNDYFGIEKPSLFVTIPVVKYAELDLDNNGIIDENDMLAAQSGQRDINCDGKFDVKDIQAYESYFADKAPHMNDDDFCTVTIADNDKYNGKILLNGAVTGNEETSYKVKKDSFVTIYSAGNYGLEFNSWTGDFQNITDDTVTVKLTGDITIGARYKKKNTYNLDLNIIGNGSVTVSTDGVHYKAPSDNYPENTLLYLKAVPEDGYILKKWDGDADGVSNIHRLIIDRDMNINAYFAEGYTENYSNDNWECITQGLPNGAFSIGEGKISFNYSSFEYSLVLINKKIFLGGNWEINAAANSTVNIGGNHGAKLVFAYADNKNYCYFYVSEDGNNIKLCRLNDGKLSVISEYGGSLQSGNTIFNAYPLNIKIICENGKLSIYGFKNNDKITYFENISGAYCGYFGLGAVNHGYMYFNNIYAQSGITEEVYTEYDGEWAAVYGRGLQGEPVSISLSDENNIYYAAQQRADNNGFYMFRFRTDSVSENSVLKINIGKGGTYTAKWQNGGTE